MVCVNKLHVSRRAARTRKVSGPQMPRNPTRIRPTSQWFFQNDICRFESSHPSQPVQSPPVHMRKPLKTARYRGISQIPRGLYVTNWATEVPFRPLVSEATFWCLVFAWTLGRYCAQLKCIATEKSVPAQLPRVAQSAHGNLTDRLRNLIGGSSHAKSLWSQNVP